tara:strand:+ start:316 stop:513 length:198 start_codon:yes stop_codon:yes gene_type:complete
VFEANATKNNKKGRNKNAGFVNTKKENVIPVKKFTKILFIFLTNKKYILRIIRKIVKDSEEIRAE